MATVSPKCLRSCLSWPRLVSRLIGGETGSWLLTVTLTRGVESGALVVRTSLRLKEKAASGLKSCEMKRLRRVVSAGERRSWSMPTSQMMSSWWLAGSVATRFLLFSSWVSWRRFSRAETRFVIIWTGL